MLLKTHTLILLALFSLAACKESDKKDIKDAVDNPDEVPQQTVFTVAKAINFPHADGILFQATHGECEILNSTTVQYTRTDLEYVGADVCGFGDHSTGCNYGIDFREEEPELKVESCSM